jgi:putative flavoprotein involved in K+ transport
VSSDFHPDPERIQTVVIGGGQAGLSVGYHLARRGLPFVILEAAPRVGDTWRRRWDSLRLFTSARFDSLEGMPFPAPRHSFPTKDEMADYLEAYAARFQLPVRTGVRVDRVTYADGRFIVQAGDRRIEAEHVVVAMASYQQPRIPAFAAELAGDIVQLHSKEYRNPSQLRDGAVLVVGAGNSGGEIALELAKAGRTVWLSGRDTGHLPWKVDGAPAHLVLAPLLLRVVFHRVFTVDTPIGRKVRAKVVHQGTPLIRVKPRDLEAAGVRRVGRTVGVRSGRPLLADGQLLDVANVIWCTGFRPGLEWIDLPIFDGDGEPMHERGLVPGAPGLSFVGLHFLYAMSSTMIHGASRDAERIARHIAEESGRRAVRRSEAGLTGVQTSSR